MVIYGRPRVCSDSLILRLDIQVDMRVGLLIGSACERNTPPSKSVEPGRCPEPSAELIRVLLFGTVDKEVG